MAQLDPSALEKAQLVQRGLQQFDSFHQPTEHSEGGMLICAGCKKLGKEVDFPCDRMLMFMMLQGLATINAMIPTGNVANVLSRFSGGR